MDNKKQNSPGNVFVSGAFYILKNLSELLFGGPTTYRIDKITTCNNNIY
jgi:hypothetical protein